MKGLMDFIWKWISTAGNREFVIPAIAIAAVLGLFKDVIGPLEPVQIICVTILAAIITMGIVAKKYIDTMAKPLALKEEIPVGPDPIKTENK